MKLTGDEAGIAALKALHQKIEGHLKFLVDEARTNTDHTAQFRGESGTLYLLKLNAVTGELVVERADVQHPSKVPGPG